MAQGIVGVFININKKLKFQNQLVSKLPLSWDPFWVGEAPRLVGVFISLKDIQVSNSTNINIALSFRYPCQVRVAKWDKSSFI
jgi:hypothetical protein